MRMKTLAAATALLAFTGTAHAADVPITQVFEPAPVSIADWTGFYAGIFAGYGMASGETDTVGTAAFLTLIPGGIVPEDLDMDPGGFLGGLTAGYNYDFGGFVLGAEADIALSHFDDSDSFVGGAVLGTTLNTSISQTYNYFGTLRARAGYAVTPDLLLFATGGLAFAEIETDARVQGIAAPNLVWEGSDDEVKFGWTVGGGAEFKVTQNISLKADALYFDLGESDVLAAGNPAVRGVAGLNGIDYDAEVENTGFLGRVGLNFQF